MASSLFPCSRCASYKSVNASSCSMLATRPTNATVVFQISECIAVIASISWTTRRPRSTINWHRFPKRVSWNKISFHWSISFPSVLTVLLSLCRASVPRNPRQTRPARFLFSLKHECVALAGEDHQPVRKDVAPLCCCPLQKGNPLGQYREAVRRCGRRPSPASTVQRPPILGGAPKPLRHRFRPEHSNRAAKRSNAAVR